LPEHRKVVELVNSGIYRAAECITQVHSNYEDQATIVPLPRMV